MISIKDKLNTFYHKHITKTLDCPACKGKMTADGVCKLWTCPDCGFSVTYERADCGYKYKYCDDCGALLNIQPGFDDAPDGRIICDKCGCENDIAEQPVLGKCKDCGKTLDDANAKLCGDCKKLRDDKKAQNLKKAEAIAKKAGAVLLAAALTLVTSKAQEVAGSFMKNLERVGGLDNNERETAINQAKAAVLASMSDSVQGYIISSTGDLNGWLTEQVTKAIDGIAAKP